MVGVDLDLTIGQGLNDSNRQRFAATRNKPTNGPDHFSGAVGDFNIQTDVGWPWVSMANNRE